MYSQGYRALCPAESHGDRNPSLLVREGDDGRVLLHCQSRQCAVEDIVAGMGLTMADLFPSTRHQIPLSDPPCCRPKGSGQRRDFVDIDEYTNAAGAVVEARRRLVPTCDSAERDTSCDQTTARRRDPSAARRRPLLGRGLLEDHDGGAAVHPRGGRGAGSPPLKR
jgi:hypothetical protein